MVDTLEKTTTASGSTNVIWDFLFKRKAKDQEPPRGTIAEWTVTIVLLLFGTTTLVQAFVIPTGSMEDALLIGDHLLVDKLDRKSVV